MTALQDWLPTLVIGVFFTGFGLLKVYGFRRGIVGGGCKPLGTRLCGSCPTWSRSANIAVAMLFCVIGLANLGYLVWVLFVSNSR